MVVTQWLSAFDVGKAKKLNKTVNYVIIDIITYKT